MHDNKTKKHSIRGAIAGLLKRTPVRNKLVKKQSHAAFTGNMNQPALEALGQQQSLCTENDNPKNKDPASEEPKHDDLHVDAHEQIPSTSDDHPEDPQPSASKPRSLGSKTVKWASQLEQHILKSDKIGKTEKDCGTKNSQDAEKPQEEDVTLKDEPLSKPPQQRRSSIPVPKHSATSRILRAKDSFCLAKARAVSLPVSYHRRPLWSPEQH